MILSHYRKPLPPLHSSQLSKPFIREDCIDKFGNADFVIHHEYDFLTTINVWA